MTDAPSPLHLLAGDRQPGETGKAVQACNDWLRLGPGRTLRALLAKYRETPQNSAPTDSLGTLEKWSQGFGWAARAESYDAAEEELKNARRAAVLAEGLALDYERVDRLKRQAAVLEAQFFAEGTLVNGEAGSPYLWVPDVKTAGKLAVDVMRFNGALVEQLRGLYADIAKETGGRVERHELGAPGGGPAVIREVIVRLQKPEDGPPDGV